jgi:hypothetical protein
MSDLFVDTETRWSIPFIALALAASGYSPEELDDIWEREILPECLSNVQAVVGERAILVLDEQRLVARAEDERARLAPAAPLALPAFLDAQWRVALALREKLVALPAEGRAARATTWAAFVHVYLEASLEKMALLEPKLDDLRKTGATEDALVAAFEHVRPMLRELLTPAERDDEPRRALEVRVAIGLALHTAMAP